MKRELPLELSCGGKRKNEVSNQLQSYHEKVHQPIIDLGAPVAVPEGEQ